jgi:hypothetical protein
MVEITCRRAHVKSALESKPGYSEILRLPMQIAGTGDYGQK